MEVNLSPTLVHVFLSPVGLPPPVFPKPPARIESQVNVVVYGCHVLLTFGRVLEGAVVSLLGRHAAGAIDAFVVAMASTRLLVGRPDVVGVPGEVGSLAPPADQALDFHVQLQLIQCQ